MLHAGRSGRAFGLQVAASFDVLGLDGASASTPDVMLDAGDPHWEPSAIDVLSDVRTADGRPVLGVEVAPNGEYRCWGRGYGDAVISADGRHVTCRPEPDAAPGAWQHWLHGQVLPLVAGIHGFELLHAAGVTIGGGAVALCGPSQTGKSAMLRALLAQGAGFFADDVVALAPGGDPVIAHAGPAVCFADGGPTSVDRSAAAAGLGAVVILRRGGEAVEVRALDPAPRRLLGLGYDAIRRDPQRLALHLDVLSRVAASARLLELSVPEGAVEAAADALLAVLAAEPAAT